MLQPVTLVDGLSVIWGQPLAKGERDEDRSPTVRRAGCRFHGFVGDRRSHCRGGCDSVQGNRHAVETGETVFPLRTIDREGSGTATYLGKYTEQVTAQINVMTMHGTGLATFTAANGDTLSASVDGQATRTGPTTLSIVEVYTVTGGTGRFADATGTFTLESTVDQTTGVSSGTFSGVIDR